MTGTESVPVIHFLNQPVPVPVPVNGFFRLTRTNYVYALQNLNLTRTRYVYALQNLNLTRTLHVYALK